MHCPHSLRWAATRRDRRPHKAHSCPGSGSAMVLMLYPSAIILGRIVSISRMPVCTHILSPPVAALGPLSKVLVHNQVCVLRQSSAQIAPQGAYRMKSVKPEGNSDKCTSASLFSQSEMPGERLDPIKLPLSRPTISPTFRQRALETRLVLGNHAAPAASLPPTRTPKSCSLTQALTIAP